jgi:hypothetical protein
VVGLASTVLLVLSILHPIFASWAGKVAGLLLFGTVAGFLVAVVQATLAVRGGPGESFEVHEKGVAHTTRTGRRAWTGQQVTDVYYVYREGWKWFPRNGWQFRWIVRFDDGSRIQFNGLTADTDALRTAFLKHRNGVVDMDEEFRGFRYWGWLLPFTAAGCGWVVATAFYLLNNDQIAVQPGPSNDYKLYVSRFDDSEAALLANAMIVCAFGFIGSVVSFGRGLFLQYRRRHSADS